MTKQIFLFRTKVCSRCKIEKHKDDFGKLLSSLDGLRRECKKCRTIYRRKIGQKEKRVLNGDYDSRDCFSCGEIKCMSEFHVNAAIGDGRDLICKACKSRRKSIKTVFSGKKTVNRHISLSKRSCTGCMKVKPLDEFPTAKQCRDGRASECKECKRMKAIQKNLASPEPTEHQEAIGFINWFHSTFPRIFIYHIPNGMKRDITSAKALKDEGVKRGVPDYHIPEWNMWVELKRRTKGSLSADQVVIIAHLRSIGHRVIVGRGAKDASRQILEHLNQ